MNFNMGMGAFGALGILGLLVGLVKEILIIILLFKGIKLADIYINKNSGPDNRDYRG